jgi:CubicO group peptidase (beta-lactamase class C family)
MKQIRHRSTRPSLPGRPSPPWTAPAALAALLVAAPAAAQDMAATVDELFEWAGPETPGCALAVSHHGEVVVDRAYGSADLETGAPITRSTRFDIGSVQKQFVAAAVLLLVEDGRIGLDDDVREYLPELPDYGHTITVDHLLTHTSGLRDWTALLQLSRESEDALTLIRRQRGLNFEPGQEWSYSNSGYVLLKEIIARAAGMPFSGFARARLFEPLEMERTVYAEDVGEVEDRALAYEKEGDGWRLDILVGNERGDGGALLSTAGDLLAWNDALATARLGAFVTGKLQEPARLNNGRVLEYARGLFLDDDPAGTIVWHTGSAASYKSSLARMPDQGVSLAILCNAGESGVAARFANPIVDLLVPDPGVAEAGAEESAATAPGAAADDTDVSGRAGLFFSDRTGEPLRLVADNGRLRVEGGPPLDMVDADRFRIPAGRLSLMSGDEFELRFVSPDRLVLTSMEGEETRYRRAERYAPDEAALQAFTGRYESEELMAVLEVAGSEDGLTIRLNGSRPFPFQPVDREVFQLGRMMARFRRDETGRVTGLDYSNPVLRSIAFQRVSARSAPHDS